MKRVFNNCILLIFLLFSCICEAKILASPDEYQYEKKERLPMLLHLSVSDYYYYHFEFPQKVDNLLDFLWERVNLLNGLINRYYFESHDDFFNSSVDKKPFLTLIWQLEYLNSNRDFISLTTTGHSFRLECSKDNLHVNNEGDLCQEKNTFESVLYRKTPIFYNSVGSFISEDYELDLNKAMNKFRRKYDGRTDSICFNYKIVVRNALLRFERNKGLSSVCPDSLDFQAPFLLQLDSCLNEFVKDKDEIEKIVFVTKMVK